MALNLNSNEEAPKVSFNTSKVMAGMAINLSKANPTLKRMGVRINWMGDDLDISAVGLDGTGKAVFHPVNVKYQGRDAQVPRDLIFYMNLEQAGIKHGGDLESSGDLETEQINVASTDLNPAIEGIDFVVTSHVERGNALLFKDVQALEVQIVDLDTNEVVYSTDLDAKEVAQDSGVVFAEFRKEAGEWSYTPVLKGIGSESHGVQNILNTYYA